VKKIKKGDNYEDVANPKIYECELKLDIEKLFSAWDSFRTNVGTIQNNVNVGSGTSNTIIIFCLFQCGLIFFFSILITSS